MSVVHVFPTDRSELRVSDVAGAAGLSPSIASRLLATLFNSHPVHRAARQTAQNLAAEYGLGVNVGIRRGGNLSCLLNFEGKQSPRLSRTAKP